MSDSMPGPGAAAGTVPATAPGAPSAEAAADPVAEGASPGAAPLPEPGAPAPLGIARTSTGDAGVDAWLERLADADHLPAEGHVQVYEDVHEGLRSTLTALDTGPARAPVPAPMPSYDNRS
ncbi:hypothetical protein ACF1BP_07805 [Streptomyces sp. NPDC014735]|uniref:hypothetical protein n=1 Tax=unclassified Streptomyces TaxID=2593676 RepID=UPI0036F8ECDE